MSEWHGDQYKRKSTGGKKHSFRGKRKFERGSFPTEVLLGEQKNKVERRHGGNQKVRLKSTKWINVSTPTTGETKKLEILRVVRNPANIDYQRRGVITKGTLLETSLGEVRVTSRPGQSGVLNGILIEKD
jgi:small subunit ribosomal protein S8e